MSYDLRWKIVRELGRGGQGTVHLVEDKQITREAEALAYFQSDFYRTILNIHVMSPEKAQEAGSKFYGVLVDVARGQIRPHNGALKILHEIPAHGDGRSAHERIQREIDVLNAFQHPNVVKLLDCSQNGEWFVTEFFSHGSLTNIREQFKGNLLASLQAIRPLVRALAELHSNERVHRDVKPDNIFYCPSRGLVLGDFGLIFSGNTPETRLTLTDENVGSWQWMLYRARFLGHKFALS